MNLNKEVLLKFIIVFLISVSFFLGYFLRENAAGGGLEFYNLSWPIIQSFKSDFLFNINNVVSTNLICCFDIKIFKKNTRRNPRRQKNVFVFSKNNHKPTCESCSSRKIAVERFVCDAVFSTISEKCS